MGITLEIDSIEDMCDLMCDNKIPEKKKEKEGWWIFTFGHGQPHAGHYVKIWGTFMSARQKMFDKYGSEWSFQYSEEEWQNWVAQAPPWCPIETELEVIK